MTMYRDERWYAVTKIGQPKAIEGQGGMSGLNHYLKHERAYVVLMWCVFLFFETTINATTILMEWIEDGVARPAWVPFVLEYTSGIAIMILFPLVLWFEKRVPLNWQVLRRNIPWHIPASIVFSILHIVLMAAMRMPIFKMTGLPYGLHELSWELLFEYRQDAWTYMFILVVINIYRFIVSRLRGEAQPVQSGENDDSAGFSERLLIKKLGKEFIVNVADIEWMESAGNYVNLHIGKRIYPFRSTLNALMTQLEPRGFRRVHRSFAVNLEQVTTITPLESGDATITLRDGQTVPLSRRYRESFRQQL